MRVLLRGQLTSIFFVLLAGCNGNDQKSEEAFEAVKISTSKHSGLAFTGVSQKYDSSDGYHYNFSTGAIQKTTFAQSGDPIVWHSGNDLFFFNRQNLSGNFFIVDANDPSKGPGSAKSFQNLTDGGPQKLLLLKNKNFLMIEMGASIAGGGRVIELDPTSGQIVGEAIKFQVPDGNPFQPVDITSKEIGDARYIFVSHRGSHFEVGGTQAVLNRSQAIFAMADSDQGLSLIANGQPVARPFATEPLFFHTDHEVPLVGGLCSIFDPVDCQQGFESISTATFETSRLLTLLDRVEISKNKILKSGSFANGFDDNSIFASVNIKDSNQSKGTGNYLTQIHLDGKNSDWSYEIIHHYEGDKNFGLGMIVSDPEGQVLIFGENPEPDVFTLHVHIENSIKKKVDLDRFPYNGVLVP